MNLTNSPESLRIIDALLCRTASDGDRLTGLYAELDQHLPLILHHLSAAEYDVFQALVIRNADSIRRRDYPTTDALRAILFDQSAVSPSITYGTTDHVELIREYLHRLPTLRPPMTAGELMATIHGRAARYVAPLGHLYMDDKSRYSPTSALVRLSGTPTARLLWATLYAREIALDFNPSDTWMLHSQLAPLLDASHVAMHNALKTLAETGVIEIGERRNGYIRLGHMYSPRTQAMLSAYSRCKATDTHYLGTGYSIDWRPSDLARITELA